MTESQVTIKKLSKIEYCNSSGKKHIAVIGGGLSAEREVSLISAKGIIQGLIKNEYQVTFIDMGNDLYEALSLIKPDLVFNALHGTYGEDGCVPGLLNIMRIPYTHSGVLASSLAFNKIISKSILDNNDIVTPKSLIVKISDNIKSDPIPRPYVIKPISQGSSIGVVVVFKEDDFNFANYDFPFGEEIIIEEYIKGRELQVAVLNGKALGVLEIKLLKNRFYDFESKYSEGFAEHLLPAPMNENLYNRILRKAERVNQVLGCKGITRVEFIYSEQANKVYTLELNTHPGFTPLSICPEIAAHANLTFNQLLEEIIKTASYE